MQIIVALICTFAAGLLNGSFALPTKNIKQWNFENLWLNFALWGFLILPWVTIFVIDPRIWQVYTQIPSTQLFILILGGIAFGIGQICFAQALKMIGFGLGFVINIGLGTGLGFLLPLIVLHPNKILTPFGYVTLLGIAFIIGGLILSYRAGHERDAHSKSTQSSTLPSQYHLGVLLSIIAGIFSACQNVTFAITSQVQQLALTAGANQLASAIVIWPVFLTFTFIPYAFYMLYLHRKNNSFINYTGKQTSINFLLAIGMGVFWFLSLVLYSEAALLIGNLGPIVAWPLFMVLIILTSNFWGWRHHEWSHTTSTIANKALKAIGLLVIAVIILGYSATLST